MLTRVSAPKHPGVATASSLSRHSPARGGRQGLGHLLRRQRRAEAQIFERAAQRGPSIELDDVVVLRLVTSRSGPIGWHPWLTRDNTPTLSLNATPDRPPVSTASAICKGMGARRREAAEEIAGRGAFGQLGSSSCRSGALPSA